MTSSVKPSLESVSNGRAVKFVAGEARDYVIPTVVIPWWSRPIMSQKRDKKGSEQGREKDPKSQPSQESTLNGNSSGADSPAESSLAAGFGKITQDPTFFRDLVENNPELIFCLAPDGEVLYANPTAMDALGYGTEELAQTDFANLLGEDSRDAFQAMVDPLLKGRQVAPAELTLFDAQNRRRKVEASLNCRFEESRAVWLRVMLRDMREEESEIAGTSMPRILVVEDDPVSARMLSRMLEHGGYETDRAATAAEALRMLGEHYYDAMTLDLMLPDRDGLDLLREIRADEDTEDLPVIVVSASADEARDAITGDAAHVVDWLNKPFDTKTLRAALSHAVSVDPGRLPRVLHVEGDSEFYEQVGRTLADIAEIDRAETLATARRMLQENDDYDLVLLGLTLPDGFGAELLPFLNRPRGRSVPVILVSADEAADSLSSHVADTLNKSHTTQQQMLDTIRAHLRP
jgi:PAS domain S-box-containing protein